MELLESCYKVYKHTFPNNKVYIGITKQVPHKRWESGGTGYKECPRMWNAIKKYGWENVKHEVLYDGLTKDEAESYEIALISEFKSNNENYGYNIENGGNVVGTHSIETKMKISNGNKGKKKKPCSDEMKLYYSEIFSGDKNPFYGKKHTEKSKSKISQSRIGNKWAKRKAIQQFSLDGFFIAEYETITEAHNRTGISMASISNAINGKYKKAGGYVWKERSSRNAI